MAMLWKDDGTTKSRTIILSGIGRVRATAGTNDEDIPNHDGTTYPATNMVCRLQRLARSLNIPLVEVLIALLVLLIGSGAWRARWGKTSHPNPIKLCQPIFLVSQPRFHRQSGLSCVIRDNTTVRTRYATIINNNSTKILSLSWQRFDARFLSKKGGNWNVGTLAELLRDLAASAVPLA
jgi:hypothetical protein